MCPYGSPMVKRAVVNQRDWRTIADCWWLDFISHLRLERIAGQSSQAKIVLYVSALHSQYSNSRGIHRFYQSSP